jgi:hypothetical protein
LNWTKQLSIFKQENLFTSFILQFVFSFKGEIFARRGILDCFFGKKGSNLAWGSSLVPATAKKGKKALIPAVTSVTSRLNIYLLHYSL